MPLSIGTSWCKNAVSADVRRQMMAMRRCGTGSLNGTRRMPGEFGAGACTDNAGIKVTPTLALTICRNVSRLVARNPGFSAAPVMAQTSSAWSRRQWPSSSSNRLSSARSLSFTFFCFGQPMLRRQREYERFFEQKFRVQGVVMNRQRQHTRVKFAVVQFFQDNFGFVFDQN